MAKPDMQEMRLLMAPPGKLKSIAPYRREPRKIQHNTSKQLTTRYKFNFKLVPSNVRPAGITAQASKLS